MGRFTNFCAGDMSGIQAGTIKGRIVFNGGDIEIDGEISGDDNVVNYVGGNMSGIQVGRVISSHNDD